MRFVWIAVGLIVTLLGALVTLQGLGIVDGSILPGDGDWSAIVGPVITAVGLIIFLGSVHRARRRS